jgi:hypothetical protein
MRKIAIITTRDFYYNYGDDCDQIVNSITEWTEVDEDTYNKLYGASHRMNFSIIERPADEAAFIKKTVRDYVDIIAKEEEAERQRKAKADLTRKEKALKKKAKDEAAEKELLATLLAKHPDIAKGV